MTAATAIGAKAISPFIEMVFTILFGVTMLAIILGAVSPMFNRAQDTSVVNDAFQNLEVLRTAVNDVATEAQGSTRTVPLSVSGGTYRTNSTYDWLYFELDPSEPTQLSGQKGDVLVRQGLRFADWFDSYAGGSDPTAGGWKNMSGTWSMTDYKYSGTNGTTYHNISGPITNWKFSATISNVSGAPGGKVFVLPTNPESLAGYWTMDEGNGSVDYDYSGNSNNATLTNMNTTGNTTSGWQSPAACKGGNSCLLFDGFDDYVLVDKRVVGPTLSKTFAAWAKATSTDSLLVGQGSISGDDYPESSIGITDTGKASMTVLDSAGSDYWYSIGSTTVSDGVWHFIAGVYDASSNSMSTYVDGELENTSTSITVYNGQNNAVYIGKWIKAATPRKLNGTVDEVMIFNRSLSANEVAALYETSAKKLPGAGGSQSVASKVTNPAIVLSVPFGKTKFDNVEVTDGSQKLTFVVPLSDVDINGTLRASRGEYQLTLRNMGVNATTGRTTVQITAQ